MNKEQQIFATEIATRLNKKIVFENDQIKLGNDIYTYEAFVTEFFDAKQDPEIGMLCEIEGEVKTLIPTDDEPRWFPLSCMDPKIGVEYSGKSYDSIDKLWGYYHVGKGFFNTETRTLLYDKSWEKVEVTIEQIAEKFGVKPEQIRIKK